MGVEYTEGAQLGNQPAHFQKGRRACFREGLRRRMKRSPGPLIVGEAQVKTKCAAASRPFQQQKSAGARTRRHGALAGCWWGAEALPESAEGVLATANKASPQEPRLSFRVCARRAGPGARGQLRPGSQRRGSRERDPEATCCLSAGGRRRKPWPTRRRSISPP